MRQAASDGESTVSAQMAAVVERLNQKLTEMVESGHAAGRNEQDEAWYVSAQAKVGRALFLALRDAQQLEGSARGARAGA